MKLKEIYLLNYRNYEEFCAEFSQNKTVAIITLVAIVGGAIATALVGSIGHYIVYMIILLMIMFGLSLFSLTRKQK